SEQAVVFPLEQDLAGLGADRLEVPRRDALPRNAAVLAGEEPLEDLMEARIRLLVQVIRACAVKQPSAVVQIVGAGLRPDDRLAAAEEGTPILARHALLADLHREAARRTVALEPFDE